ncbi:MAG: hypothetical protein ACRBHB_18020 [Arenicella sp.]
MSFLTHPLQNTGECDSKYHYVKPMRRAISAETLKARRKTIARRLNGYQVTVIKRYIRRYGERVVFNQMEGFLGKRFGVSRSTISQIRRGATWEHVEI